MSTDSKKAITYINSNNKKKKNTSVEINVIDPDLLKVLEENFIFMVQKPRLSSQTGRFICRICNSHMLGVDKAVRHKNDNIHITKYKKECLLNMMKYFPCPTNVQLEAINDCLMATLRKDIFISNNESDRRKALCSVMNSIAGTTGCRLISCGSLKTGLSMINVSDVNLYLDLSVMNEKSGSYLNELKRLSSEFKEQLNLKSNIKLEKYDCGLFCKDEHNILYHISDSTRMCYFTSDLIAVYMKIDERADKLIRIFRYFANQAFIDRTRDGLLPVEVFSLLVVFYLQQLTTPILPNLHKLANLQSDNLQGSYLTTVTVDEAVISYVSDISAVRTLWTPPINKASLAELWVGMLRFYAVEFESAKYVVSIRCSEPVLKMDRNIVYKRLAVEDPFDLKRNLLSAFYLPEAVEFFIDQLNGCYTYFAIPQLQAGPAFTSVKFTETTLQTLPSTFLVTPTFSKDNFTTSVELTETEFKNIFKSQSSTFDVSKWPVPLFVKCCLKSILMSVFDKSAEIETLLSIIELKNISSYTITSYSIFREYAMSLAMEVFKEFSSHFEQTNSWNDREINSKRAYEIVKKSANKFITESLNIPMDDNKDDEKDDIIEDELEIPETENPELEEEKEEIIENIDTMMDFDENDAAKQYFDNNNIPKVIKSSESWKIPLAFQLIYITKRGKLESSNENGVYNEHRVNALQKEQLVYNFSQIPIHKKKLEFKCLFCRTKGHRKEFCPDVVPKFDDLKFVLRDIKDEWLTKLKVILLRKYQSTIPLSDMETKHQKIYSDISNIIKTAYPESRPQMFGSSANSFKTRTSDLDICMVLDPVNNSLRLSNKEIGTILKTIASKMKESFRGIDVQLILTAKVPIIKFYYMNNIHGDISVNNILGIENSKMLKLYCDLFQPMAVLGNLLKYVAKSCDIGDASQGTLSSYAYLILLIHFLQKKGLLPVLQELYEGDKKPTNIIDGWEAWYQSDMEIIKKLWKPKPISPSLEYLWLDFFYYYAMEFEITTQVVTIKQSHDLFKVDKRWHMYSMAIEDPFDLKHNLSQSLSIENFRYILQCFAHILKLHSNNDNLLRPENAHFLLMEPSTLRPKFNNIRTVNRQNQDSSDVTDSQNPRMNTKSEVKVAAQLPKLALPFQFKESILSNHVILQTEQSTSASNMSVDLKSFSGNIDDFTMVPLRLSFGDKSIVIAMLEAKDDRIVDKLNDLLKDGVTNVCTLPLEAVTDQFANKPKINNNVQTQQSSNANDKKQREEYNGQAMNHSAPVRHTNMANPVRLMATNPQMYNNNNYFRPRGSGFREFGPQTPRQYQDFERAYYEDMRRSQNNNWQSFPNNDNARYQNKRNK